MPRDELTTQLDRLIDAWCERRCLKALSTVLGPHLGFNGLTDGWADLRDALKTVRALHRADLTQHELELVSDLVRLADKALSDRS